MLTDSLQQAPASLGVDVIRETTVEGHLVLRRHLNMTLRKVIKTRGSFPHEEAAMKLLYLALRNVAEKRHTIQGSPQALNRFAILWENRFPEHARP